MFTVLAKIRDYNGATDRCSVELEGLGQIDAWIDNLVIHQAINRGQLVHGAPVTIALPDEWRLPEAVVTAVGADPAGGAQQSSSGAYRHQHGRLVIPTNGAGTGSISGVYSPAYATAPYVVVVADDGLPVTITANGAGGFTVQVTGGPANGYVLVSWHAQGT